MPTRQDLINRAIRQNREFTSDQLNRGFLDGKPAGASAKNIRMQAAKNRQDPGARAIRAKRHP